MTFLSNGLFPRKRSHELVLLLFLTTLFYGCGDFEVARYYENGALATSAPVATDVGLNVFKNGGNAFDVAVAVGFALAVVHPEAGNIGGGGFAMVRDGRKGEIRALDFRETAPQSAYETMYLNEQGEVISDLSTFGAKACGVPGTVAGLFELWKAYGSLPWDSLVLIATKLADTGFIVDDYLSKSLDKYKEKLTAFDETAKIFFPEAQSLKLGDRLIQKDLANTLSLIADEGRDGLYKGEIADKIVACMQKHGGLITKSDLESYLPIWRDPICFTFDSFEVYSAPPPSSGGIVLGQIMKLLEPYDFSTFTPMSPQYIHLFCEAARLAFADRSAHLGDPGFYHVPSGLLDSAYLEQRRKLISKDHATPSELIQAGTLPESEQTTHFSVCDNNGNMVAVTYTLNSSYGCKLVVDGAGFLLNNEMDDFAIKPDYPNLYGLTGGEANKIEPGKKMLSSMAPTLVFKKEKNKRAQMGVGQKSNVTRSESRPYLVLGAPGGSRIITVVAQAMINLVRFQMSLTEAVKQTRFHHQWRPDTIFLEQGKFDISVTQELTRYGHNVAECEPYSDLQAIYIDGNGLMTGASDPRKRGTWAGF